MNGDATDGSVLGKKVDLEWMYKKLGIMMMTPKKKEKKRKDCPEGSFEEKGKDHLLLVVHFDRS